jgi:periplasmic divalent cation tolerance protein
MTLVAVLTTVGSRDDARRIAAALVRRRLAACAQISEIESVYRWQGQVQQDSEFRLLIKTTAARYAEVEAVIRELHAYELPQIVALPIDQAYAPYAEWVRDNSRPDDQAG